MESQKTQLFQTLLLWILAQKCAYDLICKLKFQKLYYFSKNTVILEGEAKFGWIKYISKWQYILAKTEYKVQMYISE